MTRRLTYGAIAAIAGIVFGLGAVFIGGAVASENAPATDVNSVDVSEGFVQGSPDYGSRQDSDKNN